MNENECPDYRLKPKENPLQDTINKIYRLKDERDYVEIRVREAEFFIDEWNELLEKYNDEISSLESILEDSRCSH